MDAAAGPPYPAPMITPDAWAAGAALRAGALVLALDRTALRGRGRAILVGDAALATPETVNASIVHGGGLTCFSVSAERALALGLGLAAERRGEHPSPLFLRSVEAADCTGTGISAADRARTLRAAGRPGAGLGSLKSPGHVFPALVEPHTADMARLAAGTLRAAGGGEVASWTDVLDEEGEVAATFWCERLAEKLGWPVVERNGA